MTAETYLDLKEVLIRNGYEKEITWAETVGPPQNAETFFFEYGWVVVNSGMKNQVAEKIWHKIKGALSCSLSVRTVFKHPGKSKGIQEVWDRKEELFQEYQRLQANKLLDWLQTLPWIGPITKYHLAKNLGLDVCKPDRHLVRVASKYGLTPEELCTSLARKIGDRVATVDLVIWRAANLGMI